MKSITIPDHTCFTNEDGLAFASGKYTAEILINTFDRNAAPYKSVKIGETEQVIELPDDTNRIMVRICGLEESMYLEHGNMWLDIEYHLDESKSYLTGGYLRNLDSIWVDWCGTEHHNEVDPLVSYPGDDDNVIKNRDMDSYGVYMQRNYFDYYYTDRNIQGLLLTSQVTDDSYDSSVRSDGFIITDQGYESFVNFTSVFTNVYVIKHLLIKTNQPSSDSVVSLVSSSKHLRKLQSSETKPPREGKEREESTTPFVR